MCRLQMLPDRERTHREVREVRGVSEMREVYLTPICFEELLRLVFVRFWMLQFKECICGDYRMRNISVYLVYGEVCYRFGLRRLLPLSYP